MLRSFSKLALVLIFLFAPSVYATDFSGKWIGDIKQLSHHPLNGSMTIEFMQSNDALTGVGFIYWENDSICTFDLNADVDVTRDMFSFHNTNLGYESWGFGIFTDVEGEDAIAGTMYRKTGHHSQIESADYTLFKAE